MDSLCRGLPVRSSQPSVRLTALSAPAWRRIPASECSGRQPGTFRCPIWNKQSYIALQQAAVRVAAATDESISERMAALKQAGRYEQLQISSVFYILSDSLKWGL